MSLILGCFFPVSILNIFDSIPLRTYDFIYMKWNFNVYVYLSSIIVVVTRYAL